MVKKKESKSTYKILIPFIVFILIWQGLNIIRIDNLREEIDSMPHYECWNETVKYEWKFNVSELLNDKNKFNKDAEVICQEGLRIDEYPSHKSVYTDWKYFPMSNETLEDREKLICLISEVKEVCRLNKHDVLLGEKE